MVEGVGLRVGCGAVGPVGWGASGGWRTGPVGWAAGRLTDWGAAAGGAVWGLAEPVGRAVGESGVCGRPGRGVRVGLGCGGCGIRGGASGVCKVFGATGWGSGAY